MMHEEFAERVAERLEARAAELEHGSWPAGNGAASSRAMGLRTAATIAGEEAALPEAQA